MTIAGAALAFGVAAFCGALIAAALCGKSTPFVDGPRPTNVSPSIVAAAGALLGAGIGLHGASALQLATLTLITVALAACTVCDLKLGIVPDLFTLVPLGAIVISSALHRDCAPLISAALVAVPFSIAATLSRGLGMGWGDVKLAALGGALLGAQGATIALFVASVAAVVISRLTGARGRPVAFAPYLAGGIGTVLMFGSRA